MRFRVYIAVSLDGYIATPDGGVGWLEPFFDEDYGYDSFVREISCAVMGRVTYEQVRAFGEWPYPEHDVYGVLYRLAPDQLDRVNSYEGPGYSFIEVEVEGERSGTKRASTYRTKRSASGLRPSRRYLRVLCEGARESGLPPSYIRELGAHPSVHVPVLSGIAERGIGLFETLVRLFGRPRAR